MRSPRNAFSLIELLVAIVVLALIAVLMAAIIGQVSKTWSKERNRVDNYTKARVSLDLLERDFQAAAIDRGLPGLLNAAADPALDFYVTETGPVGAASNPQSSQRPISQVTYRVVDSPSSDFARGLQRGLEGVAFTTTAPFGGAGSAFPAPMPALAEDRYQVIGPGVLRMDFRYTSQDGSKISRSFVPHTAGSTTGSLYLTVCLLVCDENSLHLLDTIAGGYAKLLSQFDANVSSVAINEMPYVSWRTAVLNDSTYTGLPSTIRQSLQVYERTIRLPNY